MTAIIALVFYTLVIAVPGVAFDLTGSGSLLQSVSTTKHSVASHHVTGNQTAADHASHQAPDAGDHGLTGKCCGAFCFTALALHVAPIAEPLMQVSAVSQVHVLHLLGHGSDPIDRPPRSLQSI